MGKDEGMKGGKGIMGNKENHMANKDKKVDYETVIGLEVHVELATDSKIFCGCSTHFGAEPNTNVCPVCLGQPGTLPVLNEAAVSMAIKAGLALNCRILPYSKFDRKNYFYPDLPKGYQISQYELPLAAEGFLDIELELEGGVREGEGQEQRESRQKEIEGRQTEIEGPEGEPQEKQENWKKRVGITRIHMEEDAGKLVHEEGGSSYVDYNRAGVPLIEIVSEPHMNSPREARVFLEKLKSYLQYTEISDCKMEEGSLRCDANISLRPKGSGTLGTKIELKNMNSFKALEKALEHEEVRQREVLEKGGEILQETRRFDEATQKTLSMRSKEEAHDYRYFPDPDLPPVEVSGEWLEGVRETMPEMPDARRERFVRDLGLTPYDAGVITAGREVADFFEACQALYPRAKIVANWVMGDLSYLLKEEDEDMAVSELRITPEHLAGLLKLQEEGVLSGKMAKEVFAEAFKTGKAPAVIVDERGLRQISDTGEMEAVVLRVIAENPNSVQDYRGGKQKALGFLVGQVMKATRGRANPQLANQLLRQHLQDQP